MRYFIVILLALVPVITADNPLPFDVEEAESRNRTASDAYRLPEDLDPIHYEVEITPYFEAGANNEAFTFDGVVQIRFLAKRDGINSFKIHQNVRSIKKVSMAFYNGYEFDLDNVTPYSIDTDHQFLIVHLGTGRTLLNNVQYILTVHYVGNINETPLSRGVFRGRNRIANGEYRWYIATHLQPTHSRQAFPSFDEPGFKSTFRIIINRPPGYDESFSNMPLSSSNLVNGRYREIFEETPRMSAYLVSFHIHQGFKAIADNYDVKKPYRILARPDTDGQGAYALQVGPPLTDWLSDYFGIEYYDMKTGIKNDQIASPYWASGATENWGLVTYRELRLLYQDGETNAADKQSIGTITAHELAHKWFGNLITCRWWDNVWINEGFASYFEYFAMDGVYPELQLADQFNIMYLHSALSADSGSSTRALQHTVNSPSEVTGHFTGISYSKGASLLLMLKHLVTETTFKKALNIFLKENSYEHVFPADLYSAFDKAVAEDVPAASYNIASFMKYWVEEQGYPVLKVTVNPSSGRIDLEQNRFFVTATANPTSQVWPIPLTYTTQENPNWDDLVPLKVMTTKNDFIDNAAGHGWVIFNVQQKGIYRVNYDERNWWLLAYALNNNHDNIHHLNRAQIVDDVFALMRSGQLSYEIGFRVLGFLKKDTSFYSWYPAINGFSWLRNRLVHLQDQLTAFDRVLSEFLTPVINDLKYNVEANEHVTKTLNRFHVLNFACNVMRLQGCVDDAVQKFGSFQTNAVPVNPNLRRHVFCQGIRGLDLTNWNTINQRRLDSKNQADEVATLRALGCTINDQAREQYLKNILNDDQVKAQDRVNAFTWFYMGDRSNAKYALDFIKKNVADIRPAVVLPAWFNNVLTGITGYLDLESLQDMEQWLKSDPSPVPEYQVGLTAISNARAAMEWGTSNAEDIITAAEGNGDLTTPTPAPTLPTSAPTTEDITTTSTTEEESTNTSTTEDITTTSTTEEESTTTSTTEDSTTTSTTEDSTTTSTTEASTTPEPSSAAIYMPTTMLLLWTALAMLLK